MVPNTGGGGGVEVVLTPPHSVIGLDIYDIQSSVSGTTTVTLRAADDELIAQFDLDQVFGNHQGDWVFFGVVSETPIAKFQLLIANGDFITIEDLVVGDPEPTVPALTPIGMAILGTVLGLAGIRRLRA